MTPVEKEDLPRSEELPDEELEKTVGGAQLVPLNRPRRITLQTDTGEIL